MASVCPNCGRKLHFYDIKAECSKCGVSIPNYNWEARLEEDNERAEQKFKNFYRALNRIAYSLWGTKLRVVRIILSFLPAVGFILPWATLKSDTNSVGLDLFGLTCNKSLIDLFTSFFGNAGLYFTNMGYEGYSGVLTYTMISLLCMVLSLVFIVIAFFLILIMAKKPKTKTMVAFDVLSIISAAASAIMFTLGVNGAGNELGLNFGDIAMYNPGGSVAWGFYVAIALLCVALVANVLVERADAKSDEALEEERLARVAVKEEKERQAEIAKEKAREEAAAKLAEEQAEKVAAAKAKIAEREAKKNK